MDDLDALSAARRRESALWLWTSLVVVFGWTVILVVAAAVLMLL